MCAWWHWLVYTRVGQVCIYLPTYERLLLTTDKREACRHVPAYTYTHTYTHTFAGNRGPGACSVAAEWQRGTPDTRQCMSCSISSSPIPTTYSPTYPTRRKLWPRRRACTSRGGPNEIGILCAANASYIATRVCIIPLSGLTTLRSLSADRFEKRTAETMRKRVGGSALSSREIINYESFENFFSGRVLALVIVVVLNYNIGREITVLNSSLEIN